MTKAAEKGHDPHAELYEEITVERRVRLPAAAPTLKLWKIDERLLAIARGELDPDDPFGGLIPIYDDELALEIEDGWLSIDGDPPSGDEMLLGRAVPRLRLVADALLRLPMSDGAAFLASQVDGVRTIEQLVEVCQLDELESVELIDELVRIGAIDLL